MDKVNSYLESIIKKNGGTGRDWKELVKLINSKPEEAKLFCSDFKQITRETIPNQKLIALDLLDFLMTEGNLPLHNQVNSKDFITFLLTLLKNKDSPEVQFKILSLIKKWGVRFENKRDILPNFYETYNTLRNNKVVFPEKIESTYFKYLAESNEEFTGDPLYPRFSALNLNDNVPYDSSANDKNRNNSNKINNRENVYQVEDYSTNPLNNYGDIYLDLDPDHYPKKYKKFVSELLCLLNCIIISNEMIDNADHKQPVDEGIREMVSQLRDLDKNLQIAISNQIDDEKLMAICLGINEDIIKLFKRYDDLKGRKKSDAFISSFHTDYADYNLNNLKENKNVNTNANPKNSVKNENPFDFFDYNHSSSNSQQVVGNPGNNLNLIDFGFGNDNNSNNNNTNVFNPYPIPITNTNINNQGNKNDVGDIFDILNQMNK